jgi:peptidoglycan/LPS O-acetylase OafA/YrhL
VATTPVPGSLANPTPPFSRSRASVSLDAIRGIAALLVLSDHTRHAFFVEYHEVLRHRTALLLPYLVTATGHQAVIIFFVLSGFLVGGTVVRSLERNTWSWKQYLTHRFVRLWLVLLPALCLVVLWDSLNLSLQHHLPSYSGTVLHHILGSAMTNNLNLGVFFSNAAFLQGIPFPPFRGPDVFATLGSDGALWSLTNEFWYYLLFPLGLFALRRHYRPLQRLVMAVFFVIIACFVGKPIFLMFPMWLIGALLLVLPRPNFGLRVRLFATVLYAAAFLGCAAITQWHAILSDCILTLATALYLWTLLAASTERSSNGLWEHFARRTARFSYTLYLVHMPMLYLLTGFLIHDTAWQPSLHGALAVGGLGCFLVAYAWLVASLTEFRIDPVRNWVEARLNTASRAG